MGKQIDRHHGDPDLAWKERQNGDQDEYEKARWATEQAEDLYYVNNPDCW